MARPRTAGGKGAPADLESIDRILFLLLPEFPLYALVPAIEALRIANQNSGRRLYDWQLASLDGLPVPAGSGLEISVHAGIADIAFAPLVFVCAGNHPLQQARKGLLAWLRRLDRHGAVLGAIDTGAFLLAEAGLLGQRTFTLHWEAIGMFRERYPTLDVREQLFVVDGNRVTCAGGHAVLDMMLQLIERKHGARLAQIVSNAFISGAARAATEAQRLTARQLTGADDAVCGEAIRIMEANMAAPLRADSLSRRLRLDASAFYQLFRDKTGEAPMRYYLKLRLQAARNALFYSDIPVGAIAGDHGFGSLEAFSRAFKSQFGLSPRSFRRSFSREQLQRFRPEIASNLKLQHQGRTKRRPTITPSPPAHAGGERKIMPPRP